MRKIILPLIAYVLLMCVGTARAQCVAKCAKAPAGPRFVDNGDGTITDNCTNLMWEKKTEEAGRHNVNHTYHWSADDKWKPDGSAFTDFLYGLNAFLIRCDTDGTNCTQLSTGFAGHGDWRLPEYDELLGIIDYDPCVYADRFNGAACIDPIFGPTLAKPYWSATTYDNARTVAVAIDFFDGTLSGGGKLEDVSYARAVRCAK
jgi:hypothetical protein